MNLDYNTIKKDISSSNFPNQRRSRRISSSSNSLNKLMKPASLSGGSYTFGESSSDDPAVRYDPCSETYLEEYLRRSDVKNALHVKNDITWEKCNDVIFQHWPDEDFFYTETYSVVEELVETRLLKILIFSGDVDDVCATAGTQDWVFKIGKNVKSLWEKWEVDGQPAGYITKFNGSFSFATVHTAGHEVPAYQPKRAYDLFEQYVNGTIFDSVPIRPTPNSPSSSKSDDEFKHIWTAIGLAVLSFLALFLVATIIFNIAKRKFTRRSSNNLFINYDQALSRDEDLDVSGFGEIVLSPVHHHNINIDPRVNTSDIEEEEPEVDAMQKSSNDYHHTKIVNEEDMIDDKEGEDNVVIDFN
jgi:hypothetical protein